MVGTGRKGPNNDALVEWLYRHSGLNTYGPQCSKHPPISQMTTRQQLDALREETGRAVTRQWLTVICVRYGIPRQGKSRRIRTVTPEQRRARAKVRWVRWWANVKKDPTRLAKYRASRRKKRS